ncbi:hypothetical protein ABQF09_00580 [Xanthomonas campestris pv. campestris]|uniref:hypothetical protein n=1 Tax=Xanthomonas campestris TaxID=339 RepID=UPI0032E45BC7
MRIENNKSKILPRLDYIASPALDIAVAQMVANKHTCDALARRRVRLAAIAGQGLNLWPDEHHIPQGFTFYLRAFPFAQNNCSDKGIPALVPAKRVVGDAHRQYSETMSPEKEAAVLSFLLHPDRAHWGSDEGATYTWIRPLGLFLAGEGKNRVSLFQRLNEEWIPACTSTEDYPAPERIVIYTVCISGITHYWAVLDGRYLEPLASPEWVLPVLQAYGVVIFREWDSEFPTRSAVERALREASNDQSIRRLQIDLEVVRARDQWEREPVSVSAWSRISPKIKWGCTCILCMVALGGTILLIFSVDWSWPRWLGASLLGAVAGCCMALNIKLITMRQSDVRSSLGYSLWAKKQRTYSSS